MFRVDRIDERHIRFGLRARQKLSFFRRAYDEPEHLGVGVVENLAQLVGPGQLRQVFNDTDTEVLWLIVGAPEELEFLQGSKSTGVDLSLIYPVDPKQLPKELAGVEWPPKS